MQALPGVQSTHAPPAAPHASSAAPDSHVEPFQHPSQQLPPRHVPEGQGDPSETDVYTQTPLGQPFWVQGLSSSHTLHAEPPSPHAAGCAGALLAGRSVRVPATAAARAAPAGAGTAVGGRRAATRQLGDWVMLARVRDASVIGACVVVVAALAYVAVAPAELRVAQAE